ncbi:hypothetical protein [Methyloligella solikamskensis]|uniref:Uncharacterized protein n=1 Tax=Methyloligella solikamskensis TaxID=1177756 RepID=A0ABW3JDF9_9HYPH
MPLPQRRKRIMREFTIDELSAVDRPAQQHATMAIMKRDEGDEPAAPIADGKDDVAHFDSFEQAVEQLAAILSGGRTEAMKKVARERPDLLQKYNQDGRDAFQKAQAEASRPAEVSKAKEDFDLLVDGIMDERKVSRTQAMTIARAKHPAAYRRYQEA